MMRLLSTNLGFRFVEMLGFGRSRLIGILRIDVVEAVHLVFSSLWSSEDATVMLFSASKPIA